jgi:hypothetical protein
MQVIGTGQHARLAEGQTIQDQFLHQDRSCQQVLQNSLFKHGTTLKSSPSALSASVMDFDVDPITHLVTGVRIGEVACVGFRENKCALPYHWNAKEGEGPWMPNKQNIV